MIVRTESENDSSTRYWYAVPGTRYDSLFCYQCQVPGTVDYYVIVEFPLSSITRYHGSSSQKSTTSA